MNQTKAWLLDS